MHAALRGSWPTGPFGEPARKAISSRIAAIAGWTARYHQLPGQAAALRWVPTHGEWRLDEIAQYASWFSRPHSGSRDDQVARDGLQHELDRPDWHGPP